MVWATMNSKLAAARDNAYQLLVHGRWFSSGTPASSTTKTGCHDIAEILLKAALITKNQNQILGLYVCCQEMSFQFKSVKTSQLCIIH